MSSSVFESGTHMTLRQMEWLIRIFYLMGFRIAMETSLSMLFEVRKTHPKFGWDHFTAGISESKLLPDCRCLVAKPLQTHSP